MYVHTYIHKIPTLENIHRSSPLREGSSVPRLTEMTALREQIPSLLFLSGKGRTTSRLVPDRAGSCRRWRPLQFRPDIPLCRPKLEKEGRASRAGWAGRLLRQSGRCLPPRPDGANNVPAGRPHREHTAMAPPSLRLLLPVTCAWIYVMKYFPS